MNDSLQPSLTASQLAELERSFHQGSRHASEALEKWVARPAIVAVDTLELVPLEEATEVLAAGESPVCFCAAEMHGLLTGEVILVFDDASGFALADMLLGEPPGTTSDWSEMALSAALEDDQHPRVRIPKLSVGKPGRRASRAAASVAPKIQSRFCGELNAIRTDGSGNGQRPGASSSNKV